MKNQFNCFALLFLLISAIYSDIPLNYPSYYQSPAAINSLFLQSGNINTVIRNDGIFNYDKVTFTSGVAGLIWPLQSVSKLTVIYTSGLWIGARVILPGGARETRLAASFYNSHYSPGNIPVIGQVPPQSVCNDPAFSGYLVNVTDQTLVNGGVRQKTAGGRTYTFNYSSWAAWPVNLGAPYVEVNGIPGYQPGWNSDRPGTGVGNSRPSELIYTVFMDYTNCSNNNHLEQLSLPGGSLPLGAEIQQLVYAFDVPGLQNSYFVRYKIINKSAYAWDSTTISLISDADVGDPADDKIACDSLLNFAYTYNGDNDDADYGTAPPAVGYALLQGPVTYTGINTDTAKFPCGNSVGYKMVYMTGHNYFVNGGDSCSGDPDNYRNAYNYMKGLDGCGLQIINPVLNTPTKYVYSGNLCNNNGWIDPVMGDKRNIINCGHVTMNSGDTQTVVYGFQISRGSSNIESACSLYNDFAQMKSHYMNCLNLIGITNYNGNIPDKYRLAQNYPNPFNPVTNINFDIPMRSFVKLSVYDVLGKNINVLVNSQLEPGSYKTEWNASDYPSGIYFYTIEANGFTETKKMVLIK